MPMMSVKVQKWNKYNYKQERNFLVTDSNIYNFNKKSKCKCSLLHIELSLELKRIIPIQSLAGLTMNK